MFVFEDGLTLVSMRSRAKKACEMQSSTTAILGLEDDLVQEICSGVEGVVVPANYNCPTINYF